METQNNTPTGNATALDITRDQAVKIALAAEGECAWRGRCEVFDTLPAGYTGYSLPNLAEPCWLLVGAMRWVVDGPTLLLCISRKTGQIVWRGDVWSGG